MIEKEKELDINKKYKFPQILSEVYIDNNILIISPESSNWIVLKNKNQKIIFDLLKEKRIKDIIKIIEIKNIDIEELIYVLTQLEAKKFENTFVKNVDSDRGLCIYLTNKCNLRCKHCYMYAGIENENELNKEEIINLLNCFSKYNGKCVTFTGGEVLERNDLIDILKYSKEKGLINTVLTNGVKWNDKLIDDSYKYIDEVQISIDGYDEISNAKIRGKGMFCKALKTVEKFICKGIKVSVAVTPIYENLKENKSKYIEFGKGLIKKYYGENFYLKFNYELLEGRDLKISKEKNFEYSKIMHEIVDNCYPNIDEEEFVLNHSGNVIFNNCGYGGITIASNGDIYFCNRIYELKSYGNIRSMEIEDIVSKSKKIRALSNVNNLRPCCDCDLKYICGGGCRINNFNELVMLNDITEDSNFIKFNRIPCNKNVKEKYYRMMVKTNEHFFK